MGLLTRKPKKPEPPADMSVVEHLDELRTRIIICVIAWGAASCGVWYYTPALLRVVTHALPANIVLHTQGLQEAFMIYLKLAIIGGGFLAAPILLWQIILFVVPALTPTEKRALIAVVPFGLILFAAGVAFSLLMVLPTAARFLLGFSSDVLQPMLMAQQYLGFVSSLALMCGLIFQMPLIMLFLSFLGIVNARMLSQYRRFAYFGCFALSAVMTPTPDAFTMIIVALPMLLLYEISIILVRIFKRPEVIEPEI